MLINPLIITYDKFTHKRTYNVSRWVGICKLGKEKDNGYTRIGKYARYERKDEEEEGN
jgi:hypothetical protein